MSFISTGEEEIFIFQIKAHDQGKVWKKAIKTDVDKIYILLPIVMSKIAVIDDIFTKKTIFSHVHQNLFPITTTQYTKTLSKFE